MNDNQTRDDSVVWFDRAVRFVLNRAQLNDQFYVQYYQGNSNGNMTPLVNMLLRQLNTIRNTFVVRIYLFYARKNVTAYQKAISETGSHCKYVSQHGSVKNLFICKIKKNSVGNNPMSY